MGRTLWAWLTVAAMCVARVASAQRDSAAKAADGWNITLNIAIDSAGAGNVTRLTTRLRMSGDRSRMDMTSTGSTTAPTDVSMLFSRKEQSVTMLMRAMKQAVVTAFPPRQAFKIAFNRLRDTVEDLGVGETILGHATRHYRVSMAFTTTFTISGQSCVNNTESVREMWLATDIDDPAWFDSLVIRDRFASAFGDSLALTAMRGKVPRGMFLRSVGTQTTSSDSAPPRVIHTRSDVSEFTHDAIPDSVFVVPSDYSVMDTRSLGISADMMEQAISAQAGTLLDKLCGRSKKT